MLGAAFGVGFILGPAVGGLLGGMSLRAPFWAAGALSIVGAAYGWFVLPESLPLERRSSFQWRRANPLGSLGLLRRHEALLTLPVMAFVYRGARDSLPSVVGVHCASRFGCSLRTG